MFLVVLLNINPLKVWRLHQPVFVKY